MIEVCAGRVRGIGVYAPARTPCSANWSSTVVRASLRPKAPSASARRVSIVIKITPSRGVRPQEQLIIEARTSTRADRLRPRPAAALNSPHPLRKDDTIESPRMPHESCRPGIRRARKREHCPVPAAVSPSIQNLSCGAGLDTTAGPRVRARAQQSILAHNMQPPPADPKYLAGISSNPAWRRSPWTVVSEGCWCDAEEECHPMGWRRGRSDRAAIGL